MHYPLTHKAALARTQQHGSTEISYTYHIKLHQGNQYEGFAEIEFQLKHNNSSTFLDYSGKEVVMLLINGRPIANVQHDGSRLALPQQHLVVGENHVIVRYRSNYDTDGNGCVSFIDQSGKQYLYTQFPPYYCHRVFPVFDQPDLKARMKLNVIAPSHWSVISNESSLYAAPFDVAEYLMNTSKLASDIIGEYLQGCEGYNMHFHLQTELLSSYLFCFVAGEFVELVCPNPYKQMKMSLYCIEQKRKFLELQAPFMWEITILSMKFFEKFFGRDYPFRKYEQVFAPEYKWGAMENPGIVTFNSNKIFTNKATSKAMLDFARVVSHELSHHWFGNLVTMRWWDDLWLNESFADLASFVCLHNIQPQVTTVKYESAMTMFQDRKNWGYQDDEVLTTHPISGPVLNTDEAQSIFDGITYSKGAAVLKQLMCIIGEEKFSRGLAVYFERFAWSNTILDDFIEVMQEQFVSELFTLDQWKEQWIEVACHNTLEASWQHDSQHQKTELAIKQGFVLTEHPTRRFHKIQVALFREDCSWDVKDTWILPEPSTNVDHLALGKYVAVLPNFGDFTFAKVLLDAQSTAYFSKNIWRVTDSLSRALLWKSFYDMTTDARISSRRYVAVFLFNAAEESCDILFETQVEEAVKIIKSYTPAKYQCELADEVFDFLVGLFPKYQATFPSRLLTLASSLTKFALSQTSISKLLLWYRKSFEPLLELKMTFEQEWQAVVKAFSLKCLSVEEKEQLFAAISARTAKSTIDNRRLTCNAIIASREQYERIYQQLVEDGSMRPSLRHALMIGFVDATHRNWIDEEYAARYFKDLPLVCANQATDPAIRFLIDLQPNCTDLAWLADQYERLLPQVEHYQRLHKRANGILQSLRKKAKAHLVFLAEVN